MSVTTEPIGSPPRPPKAGRVAFRPSSPTLASSKPIPDGNLRVRYPLMNLAAQGARVQVSLIPPGACLNLESLTWANVILIQRCGDPSVVEAIFRLQEKSNAAVVHELDDYLHGVHPESTAYPSYDPKTKHGFIRLHTLTDWLKRSDGTIFSTRELATIYGQHAKNSHVILNGLDLNVGERHWNAPKMDWRIHAHGLNVTDKSLLFGTSGSDTHGPDMPEMGESVREVLSRTKDTFFGMQTSPAMAHQYVVQHDIPLDRTVFIPPVSFSDYPRHLSMFDVALCPLGLNTFNQCKSALRLMEFGAHGIPYVASKVAPFQRFHQETEGRGGLIADNPGQWTGQILKLLKSGSYRRLKGNFLRDYVRKNCDIASSTRDLAHTLRSFVLARHNGSGFPVVQPHSLQSVRDTFQAKTLTSLPPDPKVLCPCGSRRVYSQCCIPAWG